MESEEEDWQLKLSGVLSTPEPSKTSNSVGDSKSTTGTSSSFGVLRHEQGECQLQSKQKGNTDIHNVIAEWVRPQSLLLNEIHEISSHDATADWIISQSILMGTDGHAVNEEEKLSHVPDDLQSLRTVDSYETQPASGTLPTVHTYKTKPGSQYAVSLPTVHSYITKDESSVPKSDQTVSSYETLSTVTDVADRESASAFIEQKELSTEESAKRQRQEPPAKKRKFNNLPPPIEVLQKDCCVDKCTKHLTLNDIETCQLRVQYMSEDEQLNYILKEVSTHTLLNRRKTNFREHTYHFVIGGKEVCYTAWCYAFNISLKRFKKAVNGYQKGVQQFKHGNRGHRRQAVKTTNALGWMRHYFERIGDYMPHKTQVHLPQTWTKGGVYDKMKADFISRGIRPEDIISGSYFAHLWHQHLPEFVIPKKSEFTRCATCTKLDERFNQAKGTYEQEEVIKLKKEHDDKVEAERAAYHTMRERAQREPDLYTVMIVDGMDQSKTDIPQLIKNKETAPLNKLHVHLTGVLLHTKTSEGKIPFIYTDVKEVPHDSNTTLNIILKTLIEHKDKLGDVLFLQLDNCYRENKNRYMLSFASLLVELQVFKEVIVHFLPVGHTHEDVDQMFSRISKWLGLQNAVYTLIDLERVIMESYTPTIRVRSATPQYNIKRWLEPHLAGRFSNHSRPLWFKFSKGEQQITRMHYKMWRNDLWLPKVELGPDGENREDSLGLVCLESIPDITCPPEWVVPSLDKLDEDALKKDLPHAYGDHMPHGKQIWWKNYMNNLDNLTKVPALPETWPLQELAFRIRGKQHVWEPDEQLERIREQIQVQCPVVCIGKQGVTNPRAVTHVNDYSDLTADDLVVVNLTECAEQEPYLGKVIDVMGAEVKVHWLKGDYNKAWTELYSGVGRHRRPSVQMIPLESILLFGFKLTYRKHLYQATVTEIKKVYEDLKQMEQS